VIKPKAKGIHSKAKKAKTEEKRSDRRNLLNVRCCIRLIARINKRDPLDCFGPTADDAPMTQPVGNQTKEVTSPKPSILPLIMAALFGGAVVFILSQLQFRAWIDTSDSRDAMPPVIDVNPTPPLKPSPAPSVIATAPPVRPPKTIPDGLVVSNLSPSPVRVVLLSGQSKQKQKKANFKKATPYRLPIHWDFAPNEGSQVGLLLSLPEGKLKLVSGDVLVAFALDGSRQYWGPYVVGKTTTPTKATQSSAWQLKLEP
jgi:hypothetical protein